MCSYWTYPLEVFAEADDGGRGYTPKQVAARCGFADADTLRRAFARNVGVTPAEYRKRYAGNAGSVMPRGALG
jgi:AraC-like DNA-binding protein